MGMVYLPRFTIKKSAIHVGRYTIYGWYGFTKIDKHVFCWSTNLPTKITLANRELDLFFKGIPGNSKVPMVFFNKILEKIICATTTWLFGHFLFLKHVFVSLHINLAGFLGAGSILRSRRRRSRKDCYEPTPCGCPWKWMKVLMTWKVIICRNDEGRKEWVNEWLWMMVMMVASWEGKNI